MRWDALFDDIEAQFDAAEAAEMASEVADRSRREVAELRLVDRFRAVVGGSVNVRIDGVGVVEGQLSRVGPDWLLLSDSGGHEMVVALAAVLAVGGLAAQTAPPGSAGIVDSRLGLGYALRTIARDRAAVAITLVDGSATSGTLDRVGADFFDVAEHPHDEARRRDAVRAVRAYSFGALAMVRRQ